MALIWGKAKEPEKQIQYQVVMKKDCQSRV